MSGASGSPLSTFRRSRWFALVWAVPLAVALVVGVVLVAQAVRETAGAQSFLHDYPGQSELPGFAPVGFPAWLQWQHGLNVFFLLLIVRSGIAVRTTKRPQGYWTRRNTGPLRTPGHPVRISMNLWLHLTVDTLWVVNGVLFIVLLFATGQWVRIVPTSWDVFPNAVSAALQYASLDWPTENGWANYNALQLLSYFLVVFVAAPLSIITGLRMAPGLAARWAPLERIFPLLVARRIHFPLMIFFVAFVVVHVTLVLATGALENLNHMYAGRDDATWWGAAVFMASVVVMIAIWVAVRPSVQRAIAGTMGRVSR
jgi:thiosulfate reductase cytochrome b subunit